MNFFRTAVLSAATALATSAEASGTSRLEGGFYIEVTESQARNIIESAEKAGLKKGHSKEELEAFNYKLDYSQGICSTVSCWDRELTIHCSAPNFGPEGKKAQINFVVTADRERGDVIFATVNPNNRNKLSERYLFNNRDVALEVERIYTYMCKKPAKISPPKP